MLHDGPAQLTTLGFYKERMLVVLEHIRRHLDDPLNLADLAQRGGFSPYHFHRLFRGLMGEPLMAHVRRLRLERAAAELQGTRRGIIEIALEAGYDSHEAFTRAFRQAYGVSPARFRRSGKPTGLPARNGVHYARAPFRFRTPPQPKATMNVTIEHLSPQRVAFIRHVGPYHECGVAWEQLCAWMGKEGYLANCRMIGLSHDDPESTPAEQIRYDACITVDDSFKPAGKIGVKTVAGGDYARVTHFGPYERLSRTYGDLMGKWLPRSGRRLREEPCLEVYLNDPGSTAPADLITDVYLPLA